ncbi:hypothetical protein JST97_36135 [bacterium]|nr:hypothetical protein [bacterium]
MWWLLLTLSALAEPGKDWLLFLPRENTYVCSREAGHSGRYSASLRSTPRADDVSYALLVQDLQAGNYRGRRVRFSGFLRSRLESGWCGLWLRVDGRQGQPLAFENLQKRPVLGRTDWNRYQIEMAVPAEASSVHYGGLLCERGQIWLDDFRLEVLGEAPAGLVELRKLRTLSEPSNLGFEE